MQIYKEISESNLKKYGTEYKKTLSIIINQYSDRTHFIYEIIQNAEDAEATYIHFHLTNNSLEIKHNGRKFNERDIEGVCGIANGTKDDGTRIGHFGIGFKSVYCYTEVPQIYSGMYHFKIKDQLFPEEITTIKGVEDNETCMILPFDRSDVSASTAFKEIKDALNKKITAESIIMLSNIEEINIKIDGSERSVTIEKIKNRISNTESGEVYALGTSVIVTDKGKTDKTDKDYLFFTGEKKESPTIVYQIGGANGKEIMPIRNSKIYAYFPTAKESHQNFLIHAPFDTTPARDNFKEGAEYGKHNVEQVEEVCELITDSLLWMRDNGYLTISALNTIFPIYKYEDCDILYSIYENSVDIIANGYELLPTNSFGVYKSIDNICNPKSTVIVDIFNDNDLHRLISSNKHWLSKEISTEAYAELRKFLTSNFGIQTLDWSDLVLKMDAPFLKRKDLKWMENLMFKIKSYCVRTPYEGHNINASKIPFVRTIDGSQICARDNNGQLQVYLNNHSIAKYKIDENFLDSEIIKSFYRDALRIPEYNVVQETLETILPKYKSSNVKRSVEENIEDLKTISDAISVDHFVIDKLKDKYIVTNGKEWFTPSELYLRSNDDRSGYSLMRGIISLRYLAESYFDDTVLTLKLDESFFRRIGCNSSIREIDVGRYDYLNAVEKYLGKQERENINHKILSKSYISDDKLKWSFCYEGFDRVFKDMTFDKSMKMARFLNANSSRINVSDEVFASNDKNYSGKNTDSAVVYSMIGLYLCYEKWIYINGDDSPKRPIDVDKDDLRPEYRQVKRIIDKLPFKETKNALTDYLADIITNKSDLELVKKYINNANDILKYANTMAKAEAKENAKKGKAKGVRDLLSGLDRQQQGDVNRNSDFEVNSISEKGKKKREESLEKQFAESLSQKTFITKALRLNNKKSNEEERQFLLSEYDGRCQICEKQIIKHNGEIYFEAINIIKFSELEEKVENSSKLGWNSLCLCPNCAAEYNYCSKIISNIYNQVISIDVEADSDIPIEINVEIPQGQKKKIHYSPRHFMALKKAFEIYE